MISFVAFAVILLVLTVVFTFVFGKLFGRGENLPPLAEFADVVQSNSDAVRDGRYEDIRFATVLRGYDSRQVDAVIADLRRQLSAARGEDTAAASESSMRR